jgi:transposase
MNEQIICVGLDVDDQNFHGAALIAGSGEVIEFKCRSNTKGLINQLQNLKDKFPSSQFKICYEATYIGFTLQRDLATHGFVCDVIAPSSIPRVHGNQIKTDRLDAGKLAQFYVSGLLTIVTPPEVEMEKDRDLMQSRQFMMLQLTEVRTKQTEKLSRSGL